MYKGKHTEETIEKMRQSHLKLHFKHSNEVKQHLSEINKGKVYPEEVREKISQKLKQSTHDFSAQAKEQWKRGKLISATTKIRHHVYLKENSSETIELSERLHRKIHLEAYEYLVKTNQISSYVN